LAGRAAELPAINALLNEIDPQVLDSAALPTAWLVRLDVAKAQKDGSA
jgi:hypothetical protein